VTDIDAALREMRRVLKVGGRFECLEFSRVNSAGLRAAYDLRPPASTRGRARAREISRPRESSGGVEIRGLTRKQQRYSRTVIPELGARVADDRAAYEYLVESIRKHPDQLELLSRVAGAGFGRASVRDLTFGVVAVHSGYRA